MGKFSNDRLQGTLDLLILKVLASRGATHGYAITSHIQSITEDALRVEEGSLYPALHRMEQDGWIRAEWGVTTNNRRARFYSITARGPAAARRRGAQLGGADRGCRPRLTFRLKKET